MSVWDQVVPLWKMSEFSIQLLNLSVDWNTHIKKLGIYDSPLSKQQRDILDALNVSQRG